MAYVGAGQNKYTVFPVDNYTFGQKTPKVEKQRTLEARFKHLKEKCVSYCVCSLYELHELQSWHAVAVVVCCGNALSGVQVC